MDRTNQTTTRRSFLHRGLGLSFGLATLLGTTRVPDVAAEPRKPTVAENTQSQREACEVISEEPGKLAVLEGPNGGNTTECKGGSLNGWTCINTKKETTCWQARTEPPTSPLDGTTAPPLGEKEQPPDGGRPAGGGAVDPTGGNEQPSGGGHQAGGGAGVDPSGGVAIAAYGGDGKRGRAKRRRRGRGKGRKA